MKGSRKTAIAAGAVLLLLCAGVSYAAESRTELLNRFSTGVIDIEIKEYQEDGTAEEGAGEQIIMPGAEIPRILRVKNHGNDCYIRVRIDPAEGGAGLEDHIYGTGEKWIRCADRYLYYQDILHTGEEAEVFQGLRIPGDFSQEYEQSVQKLSFSVDAVQSKNVSPDFDSRLPWGSLEIQKCERKGDYNFTAYTQTDEGPLQIVYLGESKSLIANEEDFFKNFPLLFPGDEYTDSAELKNDSNTDISLYLRTETAEGSRLPDEIELQIVSESGGESQTVYEGSLRAEELQKEKLVAFIPKNQQGKLTFMIRVPETLQNEYTDLRSYVKWIFSTSPEEEETVYIAPPENRNSIQTGDTSKAAVWRVLSAVSAAGIAAAGIFLALGKRRSERRREQDE